MLTHEQIYKIVVAVTTCIVTIAGILLMTACSVTRTITTSAESFHRGDTAVHITTKTTETYHATEHFNRLRSVENY